MNSRDKARVAGQKAPVSLPDEKIQQLAQMLFEAIDPSVDFAAFEEQVLEVSNEMCRQVLKKNSTR